MNTDDLIIVINSTDSYSDVWNLFFDNFFKCWPDCPYKVYLLTNETDYNRKNVTTLKSFYGANWSERIIYNKKRLNAEYILLILEDHIFTKPIKTEQILQIQGSLNSLDKFGYIRLTQSKINMGKKSPLSDDYLVIDKSYPYNLSTLESIWNSDFLFELTENKWNPWEFEKIGSLYSITYDRNFYMTTTSLISYDNAIVRSKWSIEFYRKYKDINFDFSSRKIGKFNLKDLISFKAIIHKMDFLKIVILFKRFRLYIKRKIGGLL